MFKKFFNSINSQTKTITSAAIIIGSLSLVSRLLGILRDRILASEFGAGDILDIYYASFRLPDLVYNVLVLGAVSAGLIPVFAGLVAKHKTDEAWKVINTILNVIFIGLVIVCGILFIFAPIVMPLITPGFSGTKSSLVIELSRIMFLSPIFLGLSAIFSSILQSFKRFFIYSLAPIFYNVGIIIGALFFVDRLGVSGLAWGVVLGAFLHMIIQLAAAYDLGYRYQPLLDLSSSHVKIIGQMMVPRTLTLIISQINILVVTIVASTLAVGSLAIFNLANNLQSFPLGVFGISFAIAALPTLSELAENKSTKKFVKIFSSAVRQILFFIIPISVLLYVLRAQVVRVILGSGSFNWYDTRLTAASLAIFCFGLFAQALLPLVIRAFYAFKNSRTPFYIGLFALVVNLGALIFFRWVFSFTNSTSFFISAVLRLDDLWQFVDLRILALPAALSVSGIINLLILIIWLRKRVGFIDGYKIINSTFRILFASLAGGLMAYASLRLIGNNLPIERFFGVFIQGLIGGIVGLVGFWLVGVILKVEELFIFMDSLKKKFLLRVNLQRVEDSGQEGDGV